MMVMRGGLGRGEWRGVERTGERREYSPTAHSYSILWGLDGYDKKNYKQ